MPIRLVDTAATGRLGQIASALQGVSGSVSGTHTAPPARSGTLNALAGPVAGALSGVVQVSSNVSGVVAASLLPTTASLIGNAAGAGLAFTPDSGYSISGTASWDSQITVTKSGGGFGSTGPTLALFDDFRNGVSGNVIPHGASPVAGSSAWDDDDRPGVKWVTGGRNGLCARFLDNSYIGNYCAKHVAFPNTTGIYIFYAEHLRGWDLSPNETASFCKHDWLNKDRSTNGKFNTCTPTFTSGSSYFVGNNSPPLPQWSMGGGPRSRIAAAPNGWHCWEIGYVGGANPTSNAGRQYCSVRNSSGAYADTNTSQVLFSATTNYTNMNGVWLPGWFGNVDPGNKTIDRDDFYIAIGAQAYCRVFVGDASTYTACTSIMPCTIDSWADGSVTFKARRGGFGATLAGLYLYWANASNTITRVGRFNP